MEFVNGYIYILWNDMYKFYGDNVFKIGRTTDIQKRIFFIQQHISSHVKLNTYQ